jgi:hypothetical protein
MVNVMLDKAAIYYEFKRYNQTLQSDEEAKEIKEYFDSFLQARYYERQLDEIPKTLEDLLQAINRRIKISIPQIIRENGDNVIDVLKILNDDSSGFEIMAYKEIINRWLSVAGKVTDKLIDCLQNIKKYEKQQEEYEKIRRDYQKALEAANIIKPLFPSLVGLDLDNEKLVEQVGQLAICVFEPYEALLDELDFPEEYSDKDVSMALSDAESDLSDEIAKLSLEAYNLRSPPRYLSPYKESVAIEEVSIRGKIATYAKEVMGAFIIEYKDGDLFISQSSNLRRPTDITGVLGSKSQGDHVIAISYFLKMLLNDFKEKPLSYVLDKAMLILSDYNVKGTEILLKQANYYVEEYNEVKSNIEKLMAMVNFVRQLLIPSIIALWNQRIGSAFHRSEKKNLSEEGKIVKDAIAALCADESEARKNLECAAEIYINGIIDYWPLPSNHKNAKLVKQKEIDEALYSGKRTNHIDHLALACSLIIENFINYFEFDISGVEVAGILMKKFLTKVTVSGSWMSCYEQNSEYLPADWIGEVTAESICKYLINKIIIIFPMLLEEEKKEEVLLAKGYA